MNKPVKLSVHRNTRDQRRRHEASKFLVSDAKRIARFKDVEGFVIVAWRRNEVYETEWFRGPMSLNTMPEFAKATIQRAVHGVDVHLTLRGQPPEDEGA